LPIGVLVKLYLYGFIYFLFGEPL